VLAVETRRLEDMLAAYGVGLKPHGRVCLGACRQQRAKVEYAVRGVGVEKGQDVRQDCQIALNVGYPVLHSIVARFESRQSGQIGGSGRTGQPSRPCRAPEAASPDWIQ